MQARARLGAMLAAAGHNERSESANSRAAVEREFERLTAELEAAERAAQPSLGPVPRFYSRAAASDPARVQLSALARAAKLEAESRALLTNDELEELWELLKSTALSGANESAGSGGSGLGARVGAGATSAGTGTGTGAGANDVSRTGDLRLNYEGFCAVAAALATRHPLLFPSSVFLSLPRDGAATVSIDALFEYVVGRTSLWKTRVSLSTFDSAGTGALREMDLERYVRSLMATIPQLAAIDDTFVVFYLCTAVRKFAFFLDPQRRGQIAIRDLLLSPVLSELFDVREADDGSGGGDERNWFSAASARRIYAAYLTLDEDHNGMLSRAELARFGSGTLTDAFLDRVFEECHTYEREMDYKSYLDFTLAMENKGKPAAAAYLFRLLDLDGSGSLTRFTLRYFFTHVTRQMIAAGYEPVQVEDVCDELFDMVKPADPMRITLADILAANVSATFFAILTEVSGFWCYDNRELVRAS